MLKALKKAVKALDKKLAVVYDDGVFSVALDNGGDNYSEIPKKLEAKIKAVSVKGAKFDGFNEVGFAEFQYEGNLL